MARSKTNTFSIHIPSNMKLPVALDGFATTPDIARQKAFLDHIQMRMETAGASLTVRQICCLYEGAIRSGCTSLIGRVDDLLENKVTSSDPAAQRVLIKATTAIVTALLKQAGKPFTEVMAPVVAVPDSYWERCCIKMLCTIDNTIYNMTKEDFPSALIPRFLDHYRYCYQKDGPHGQLSTLALGNLGTSALIHPNELLRTIRKAETKPHPFASLSVHKACLERAAAMVDKMVL